MDLIVSDGSTTVTAVADLERYLEHGSLAVRLDSVAIVVTGIHGAVQAVTPSDAASREADPARMARVAQMIMQVASAARALAASAPADDPNALAVTQALDQLHVYPSESNPVKSVTMDYAIGGSGSWPVLRFGEAVRIVGGYLISNVSSGTNPFKVVLRNAATDGSGTATVAFREDATVAGEAYALDVSDAAIYATGELAVIDVETPLSSATFSIQIDYQPR